MALNQSLTGIVDESAPSDSLFDDAAETASSAVEAEKTSPAEPTKAQDDAAAVATPADTASAGAPVEPFSFAGREWASREAAENDFKSWEGRIQAEQGKVRDYEKRLNDYWDYVQSVTRENEALQRGAAAQPEPADEKPKPEAPKIDFDQIGRIMEIARNQGMDPMAVGMKAYAAQAEKVYEHKLNERLAAVEKPLEEMQIASTEQTADREMFLWAQGLKDSTGAPAYPELQRDGLNDELVVNVHNIWKKLAREFGPKYAYSAPGFDYAYRLALDLTPARATGPAATAPQAADVSDRQRDAQGRFLPTQAAAAAASDITGNQPNPARTKPAKSSTQEMLEELASIKPVKIGQTELGFYE